MKYDFIILHKSVIYEYEMKYDFIILHKSVIYCMSYQTGICNKLTLNTN
jgi:hypothetical protein